VADFQVILEPVRVFALPAPQFKMCHFVEYLRHVVGVSLATWNRNGAPTEATGNAGNA